jgi:hypothetical protein
MPTTTTRPLLVLNTVVADPRRLRSIRAGAPGRTPRTEKRLLEVSTLATRPRRYSILKAPPPTTQ